MDSGDGGAMNNVQDVLIRAKYSLGSGAMLLIVGGIFVAAMSWHMWDLTVKTLGFFGASVLILGGAQRLENDRQDAQAKIKMLRNMNDQITAQSMFYDNETK